MSTKGVDYSPSKVRLPAGASGPHLKHGSLDGMSIGSSVFAGLAVVTNTQTDVSVLLKRAEKLEILICRLISMQQRT